MFILYNVDTLRGKRANLYKNPPQNIINGGRTMLRFSDDFISICIDYDTNARHLEVTEYFRVNNCTMHFEERNFTSDQYVEFVNSFNTANHLRKEVV